MAKKYELPEESFFASSGAERNDNAQEPIGMVSEPIAAGRLDTMYMHNYHVMPCTYSDEEFKEELALSEASGFVSNEDFKKSCFEKWGVALYSLQEPCIS